ncbi:MAG: hypothetical protein JL50_20380 [Peptococcaceae bacterium BICA1-7]|nr:MAG: hypothetical protein JL50_20380 [Peptococcaceae bacterium BICA1-7]
MRVKKDLVVLVADKNMEYAVKGLLCRDHSFGIRKIMYDCYVHPEHDPGCLLRSHDFLRPFSKIYSYALVILDHDGCGHDYKSRESLELELETRLFECGWEGRASAVIIEPELDIWVWSNSPHVESVLGWAGKVPNLKSWLISNGYANEKSIKPNRPKEAFEHALRIVSKARSSSIYSQLARIVSTEKCSDSAFSKLKTVLKDWFPLENVE